MGGTIHQNITNMKKKLIPAPLDGKNVTRDWICEIFDNYDCILGGKRDEIYTGFVDSRPTTCIVNGNTILWHINKWYCSVYTLKEVYENLIKRLKEHDTPPLVVKYDTSMKDELILLQQFFFEGD